MRRILPALAFCVVALLSACSGGSRSPTEARTPAGSPTPGLAIASPAATLPASATQGPQDSCTLDTAVCNVAASALKAVRTKDYEWLLQNSQPKPYTCPGPSLRALGGPFPLCTGAAPGERRPGYAIAFLESEGAIYDINAYKAELQRFLDTPLATAADQYGPAATTLYSIACPAEPMPCRDRFAIVFSQRPAAIPE